MIRTLFFHWILLHKNTEEVFKQIMTELCKTEFDMEYFKFNDDWKSHNKEEQKVRLCKYSKYLVDKN